MTGKGQQEAPQKRSKAIDKCVQSSAPSESLSPLDSTFRPGNWDVICQGGKESHHHIGNRRFRLCIYNNLNTYMKSDAKNMKSAVVSSIIDAIRDSRTGSASRFVRHDSVLNQWFEVSDKMAREKVGHALRGAVANVKANPDYDPVAALIASAGTKQEICSSKHQGKKTTRLQDSSISSCKRKSLNQRCSDSDQDPTEPVASSFTKCDHKKVKIKAPNDSLASGESIKEWEQSLQVSSAVFEASDEGWTDSDEATSEVSVSTTKRDTVEKSSSQLQWNPPGAAGLEEWFVKNLKSLQPEYIKEDDSHHPNKPSGSVVVKSRIASAPTARSNDAVRDLDSSKTLATTDLGPMMTMSNVITAQEQYPFDVRTIEMRGPSHVRSSGAVSPDADVDFGKYSLQDAVGGWLPTSYEFHCG